MNCASISPLHRTDTQIKLRYCEETTKVDKLPKYMDSIVCRTVWHTSLSYQQKPNECQQKYGSALVWKACCNIFNYMNLAAVGTLLYCSFPATHKYPFSIIDGETLCVHGGLSPDIRTLDQIRVLSRAQEIPHEGAFCGMPRLACC